MSLEFTVLEVRCALTVLRHARDELRDRQIMLAEKVFAQDQTARDAALELENRSYVIGLVCQKLWVELHLLQGDTVPLLPRAPTDGKSDSG